MLSEMLSTNNCSIYLHDQHPNNNSYAYAICILKQLKYMYLRCLSLLIPAMAKFADIQRIEYF